MGFISRHVGRLLKLGLWSLRVIKAWFFAMVLILSSSPSPVAIRLSSLLMSFSVFVEARL